jgi:TonB family protein
MGNNINYPQEAIDRGLEGKVIFSFIVETDGSLSEFKILQSPSVILSQEVERVFNNSPKWEPGLYMDKKVRVRLTVPVVLVIQR